MEHGAEKKVCNNFNYTLFRRSLHNCRLHVEMRNVRRTEGQGEKKANIEALIVSSI